MKIFENKKGAELSMNVIIIAILVILVLVIVAVFFTGGMASLTQKIADVFRGQTVDTSTAVLKCNNFCSQYETTGMSDFKNSFCEKEFSIDTDGDGKEDFKRVCPDLGVDCPVIDAEGGC